MNANQRKHLNDMLSQAIAWDCRLDRYTSFAIGGPAEALVKVALQKELKPLLAFLETERIPWRTIGKGSNVLVKDEGFAGVIFILGDEFSTINQAIQPDDSVLMTVGAGCSLARCSMFCAERGYTGLEFGCGIPGTVGGAVIMNAGAWGQDIATVIQGVTIMTAEGETAYMREELTFSYRSWDGFAKHHGKAVVTKVDVSLTRGDISNILQHCKMLQEKRKAAQPSKYPSAGSFFKNPPNDSAGRLIESSGLKGMNVGGAMISLQHGNFLVNTGHATANDVINLMKIVQEKVKSDSGIDLEPEVHFI